MESELLQMIGRLYVEASRYQGLVQQLQDTVQNQQVELNKLRAQQGEYAPQVPQSESGPFVTPQPPQQTISMHDRNQTQG